jgi:hypothetical protein
MDFRKKSSITKSIRASWQLTSGRLRATVVVSLAMLKWTLDLDKVKRSASGRYIKKYMIPFTEATRLLSLIPMAYGAGDHHFRFIVLGFVILVIAWCNCLNRQVFRTDGPWVAEVAKCNPSEVSG